MLLEMPKINYDYLLTEILFLPPNLLATIDDVDNILRILTSQVYEEKEVQVDDEATGKSLHSMKKVKEEIFLFHNVVTHFWVPTKYI